MRAEVRTEPLHYIPLVSDNKAVHIFDLEGFNKRMSDRLEKVRSLASKNTDDTHTACNGKEKSRS